MNGVRDIITDMTKPNNNNVATLPSYDFVTSHTQTHIDSACMWEKIKAERKSKCYKHIFTLSFYYCFFHCMHASSIN